MTDQLVHNVQFFFLFTAVVIVVVVLVDVDAVAAVVVLVDVDAVAAVVVDLLPLDNNERVIRLKVQPSIHKVVNNFRYLIQKYKMYHIHRNKMHQIHLKC